MWPDPCRGCHCEQCDMDRTLPPPAPHLPADMPEMRLPDWDRLLTPKQLKKQNQFKLAKAIGQSDLRSFRELEDEHMDFNCTILYNKTPLTYAIETGNFDMARGMVRSGADVNLGEREGNRQLPLHLAVKAHSSEMVRLLLAKGARVDGRDSFGLTPLMLACHQGRLELAKILEWREADVNAADDVGRTALHRAAEGQHHDVIQFLLSKGAHLNARDQFSHTALYHSIIMRHVGTVRFLLLAGISPDGADSTHQSPIQVALCRTDRENVGVVMNTVIYPYYRTTTFIPSGELAVALKWDPCEESLRADLHILLLLVNAGAVPDFRALGHYFKSMRVLVDDGAEMEKFVPLWHFLTLTSKDRHWESVVESMVGRPVLEEWGKGAGSLKWHCRSAIRSLLGKVRPCNIAKAVDSLPLPVPMKDYLNFSAFFERYPQFSSLFDSLQV